MRKFSNNWFDGSKNLFDIFLSKFKNKKNVKFLEIGSYEGRSTCYMLDHFLMGDNSSITCIDSWQGGFEHLGTNFDEIYTTFINNISTHSNKVKIARGDSYTKLLEIQSLKQHFDFIYIDGGHTAKDVIQDSTLSFPLLKVGGIIAFDDYLWGHNQLPAKNIPKQAIDNFLMAYEENISILNSSHQVWIEKTK